MEISVIAQPSRWLVNTPINLAELERSHAPESGSSDDDFRESTGADFEEGSFRF